MGCQMDSEASIPKRSDEPQAEAEEQDPIAPQSLYERLYASERSGSTANRLVSQSKSDSHPTITTEAKEQLPQISIVASTEAHEPKSINESVEPASSINQTAEQTIRWRDREIILRTQDGTATFFRDKDGRQWTSADGQKWTENGTDASWHGNISIDQEGNLRTLNSSWGVNTTLTHDGNLSTSFTTSGGKLVSIDQKPDGTQTLTDGNKIWTSADGKTWKSGRELQKGEMHIDEYGRLRKSVGRGEISVTTSAETQSISRTMWRMENQYNVKFMLPGSMVEYSDEKKTKVPMRMPTSDELKVIENVLDKFSHLSVEKNKTDFDGFRIGFTAFKGRGKEVNVAGWYDNSPEGVYFGPYVLKEARGVKGLEGVALHELSHELQNSLWKEDEVPKKILDFFGYEMAPKKPEKKDEEPSYRIKDKDGNQWQYLLTKADDADGVWLPVKDGVQTTDLSQGITDRQMRELLPLARRPASEYFYDPAEAHAEALALFLNAPITLYDSNPSLYYAVKSWDQDDINRKYKPSKAANGSEIPKMIRSFDGKIVPNTDENRMLRTEQEQVLTLLTPSYKPTEAHKDGSCNCGNHRNTSGKKR